MKDLVTLARDWWTVKTAKTSNPELEEKIREERTKLHDNVNLLRLTAAESKRNVIERRWSVMDELITDHVARR